MYKWILPLPAYASLLPSTQLFNSHSSAVHRMVFVLLLSASDAVRWYWQPAIFFGLYSASFIHCVRWLLFEDDGWKIRKKINWWLLSTTLLVFLLSMALFCAVVIKNNDFAIAYYRASNLASNTLSSVCVVKNKLDSVSHLQQSAIQWSILVVIDGVMVCPPGINMR